MEKKPARGRPTKPKGERLTETLHARASDALKRAVLDFKAREMLADEGDAIRELIKIALRKEGIL